MTRQHKKHTLQIQGTRNRPHTTDKNRAQAAKKTKNHTGGDITIPDKSDISADDPRTFWKRWTSSCGTKLLGMCLLDQLLERNTSQLAGNPSVGTLISAGSAKCDLSWVHKWQEWHEDLWCPGSMPATNRLIDFLALNIDCEKFNFDRTDAYCQPLEKELTTVD